MPLKRHRKIKRGKKRSVQRWEWNNNFDGREAVEPRVKATKKTWDAIKTAKNNRRVVTGYYRKGMCIASLYVYIYRILVKSGLNYSVCKVSPRFERRFMNYVTGEFIGAP